MQRKFEGTVTRDPETEHVRSIKPGEEVESMWNGLGRTVEAIGWSPTGGETMEGFLVSYVYIKADELVDGLLFPQGADGEMVDNLFRNDPSAKKIFEQGGSIDIRKFANDLDMENEPMDDNEFEMYTDSELDGEQLAALEDDDGDSDWDIDDESSIEAIDNTIEILSAQMKKSKIREPVYYLPILWDPPGAKQIPDLVGKDAANLMHAMRNAFRRLKEYVSNDMAMHADFMRHIDRQKSIETDEIVVFKNYWHQADQEPGTIKRYGELMLMVATMDQMVMQSGLDPGPFELAKFMLLKDNKRSSGDSVDDIFPIEWRKAIRPVIIRLFRAGVICSSYDGSVAGITIAGTEPSRSPDLYLDYRIGIPPSNIVSHLKDPTSLDRDFIIKRIGLFASSNPDARFSVLRLWSAPHFYPLMLSIDQRATCAFLDDRGRAWEFKFVPKDMPYSEWSIHHQLSLRLEPWKNIFGLQIIVVEWGCDVGCSDEAMET
ncbi:hypothetical protein SNOG_16409 [Parastagonospora nodorum SN15]|uniref:Uncharacterized protein n=1 Tax=Phaeosphaeria nodorum (strain SN15 / ATCC MYA-4574 / FGSC 10173) TaxID=321614 RepID=Q0TVT3_PHANO|nr:hypothetical protein SNOG_16409 [Parastagonospora nodorum SN15]EAT76234.2 hypothetical protein SNOG_16409 [Parastagonospora nodorum SN15]